MKTLRIPTALFSITAGVLTAIAQQPADPVATPAAPSAAAPSAVQAPATPPAAVLTNPAAAAAAPARPAESTNGVANGNGQNGIRLNFRGVPLETVLDYLSKAAGFIIIPETDVKGKVDVWSSQPLTKDEAYDLLNTILKKNNLSALRNGRTLTIVSLEEARKRDLPVTQGSDPEKIPKTDQMVTQIIPIRYADATQITRDLQPLMRDYAIMTANQSGNALVITDTQASIKRMMEIVKALDTSISSISSIRVWPLRYADAKDLATVIKDLFDTSGSQQNRGGRGGAGGGGNPLQQFFNARGGGGGMAALMGGGGPGGGGGGRGGGGGGGGGASEARQAASRVVAVADERTNSLIVSAPDEYIPAIEKLVDEVDKVVDDVTVLRVFHLKNADPTYMSQQLATLFPDTTRGQGGQGFGGGGFQFAGRGGGGPGGGFGGGGRGGGAQTPTSERTKKMGRVLSVPDARTASIIVSAAAELMPQIAQMIEELDVDPARKQKVFVFSLDNANVEDVEGVLADMFQGNSQISSRRTQNRNNNALNNRQQNTSRTQGTGGGFGGGRTGGTGGTGGGFGGQ